MNATRFYLFLIPVSLLAPFNLPGAEATASPVPQRVNSSYLDQLRAEVRSTHPSLDAATSRLQAAEASIHSIRLWEDPRFGVGTMLARREMRQNEGDVRFMLEQSLPRYRLFKAQTAKLEATRSLLEAETEFISLELETQVALTAIELALTDEMLALESDQLAWLDSMVALSNEKLRDPMALSSAPLRFESQRAQEQLKLNTTLQVRERLETQLNLLLGRAIHHPWPNLRLPASLPPIPDLATLIAKLRESSPQMKVADHRTLAAKSEIEITRRERSPVFSLGVETSAYSGDDLRQTMITAKMSVPWFNRSQYRANTARAEWEHQASEKDYQALERRLSDDLVSAHSEAEIASRTVTTYTQDIIPRSIKALNSTKNAWISSQLGALEVLDASRSLLDAKLEERRSVAVHLAALEKLRSIIPTQHPIQHPTQTQP